MIVDWSLLILESRNKTGKSVDYIAKQIKCDYRHIRRLSTGEVKEPRWTTALKLLDYYYENVDKDFSRIRLN